GQPDAVAFLDAYTTVLAVSLDGFEREGKRFAVLAIGCTGGKHRSVAIAEEIAARLAGRDVPGTHRDLGREWYSRGQGRRACRRARAVPLAVAAAAGGGGP